MKASRPTLIVIGTGMAGAKVIEETIARAPGRFQIRMFGAEPHGTYNRILLSSVLGGFKDPNQLWLNPLEWYEKNEVFVHAGVRAEAIDREKRVVIGAGGKVTEPYDILVLATGSRPFVPPMQGTNKEGVFLFRTLEDCEAIGSYARQCQRAVVIGGGLLGLEAARGLLSHGVEVTVVEVAPQLMIQQLDATAAGLLQRKMETMGVRIRLGTTTTHLLGDGRVAGLQFQDGSNLDTDMVVVSCGIRPNVDEARAAGLQVERAVVVDDQLRTSDPAIFAVGECAQHRGKVYGLVDPIYEQARILAEVLARMGDRESRIADCGLLIDQAISNGESGSHPAERNGHGHSDLSSAVGTLQSAIRSPDPRTLTPDSLPSYLGSRLATTLKVMGVELTSMGEVNAAGPECEVVSHLDPSSGAYRKLVIRENRLVGCILLGTGDPSGTFLRLFKSSEPIEGSVVELLIGSSARDALLKSGGEADLAGLPDDTQICNCHAVPKGKIVTAIREGKCSTVSAVGDACRAGTGCGTCQPLLTQLLSIYGSGAPAREVNRIEVMKQEKDGLDCLPDILQLSPHNNWAELTEDDKQRAKWHGLFFRKPTPGNFMMRLRLEAGRVNSRQFRTIADLSDEYGKGFCDLTTRQQIQLRWFTLADVSEVWRRLEEVGLHSKQTGMDNVRGVCGCPVAGLTPHELLDASQAIRQFNEILVGNKEFTNLPRKFNVTITGCLENCCHPETQDIGLVPAYRELDGQQVNGFNLLVGGKQGSGGYRPATPLDVFVRPEDAARLCAEITLVFRDHGSRANRTRSRLAFLIEDKGIAWFRKEVSRRLGQFLHKAGVDMRKKSRQGSPEHSDHLGIHPQRSPHGDEGPACSYVGMLVPVGRITTTQMRGVADLADRYGDGQIRVTPQQNLVIVNIPENRLGALMDEPLFQELPFDPSPIMRGLVSCTGNDYCHLALIETKGHAIKLARELEKRTSGKKIQPLTIHWSGCPAGCGLHQVATIGLQGCRSRLPNGDIVDAAHVSVKGQTGPQPRVATDLMYDVPCDQLPDALEPLVNYLPRS
jgi:NAD(P)H-nitrite reductase large subunit